MLRIRISIREFNLDVISICTTYAGNSNTTRYSFAACRITVCVKCTIRLQADSTALSIGRSASRRYLNFFNIVFMDFFDIFINFIEFSFERTNRHAANRCVWVDDFSSPVADQIPIFINGRHQDFIISAVYIASVQRIAVGRRCKYADISADNIQVFCTNHLSMESI